MPRFSETSEDANSANKSADASAVGEKLLGSLASDNSNRNLDKPLDNLTKAKVVAESTLIGMATNGLDEVVNNPGRFGAEILGATAITLALKGPNWVKIPAMGVAAVGTYAFASHAVEAGGKALTITSQMTERNLAESSRELRATLGPLAFDSLLMVGSGKAGAHLAGALPKTISTRAIADAMPKLSFEMGPQLAFEGAGLSGSAPRLRFNKLEPVNPVKDNTMAMTAHNDGTGGGSKYVQKDGYRVLTSRGSRGEDVQLVEKMPVMKPVELIHGDHSISKIGANGKIVVAFPTGEARILELGKPISRVTVSEYAGGQKHYRLNETVLANMEVNNVNHEVKAVLANGDKLHIVDNVEGGFMNFNHKDGMKTWVEHSGRLVFQLPNGVMSEATIPSKLAHIRLTERTDGSKQFQFLDPEGALLAQKVEVPALAAQAKTFDDIPQWRELNAYIGAREQNQGFSVNRVEPDAGGMLGHNNAGKEHFPVWNPRHQPTSTGRIFDESIAGVDRRVMRGNDLDTPADMALAQQGHGWMVKRYLDGLDRHDDSIFKF
jgi:hypothetical protein